MDYNKLAQECIRLIGGPDNIRTMAHCATRLRLQLADKSKVQVKELEALEGVLGVKEVGAQTQIIIGPGVPKVYKAIEALTGERSSAAVPSDEGTENNAVAKLLDTITGIFGPVINAITAGGMVKAFLLILGLFGLSSTSQEYYILNFIADSVFYFLPVLLAVSSANKFGCNPYIAAVVGGVLLHPNWTALVNAGEPVSFFHVPVTLWSYSSSVLPIILTIFFMSYVEKFAEKYSPTVVKAVLRPLLTLGITAPVALIVIGPLGSYLGKGFAVIISFLDTNLPVLVPTIVGALFPLLVFVGMHLAIFPALQTVQLADMGYETVCGPGVLASNFAVAGATLAVAIRSKNANTKELGFSTGATALCGITEPALYGVVVKYKRPLAAAMIGGAAGGIFAGISHLKRYALATPGIPALPTFMGEDPSNIVKACITLAIGFSVSFIIAWFMGIPEENDKTSERALDDKEENNRSEKNLTDKTENRISAPVPGNLVSMEKIPDPVFSSGALGFCMGIEPESDSVCSPVDGEIVMIADTKHAIGIQCDNGMEMLIHVGINTVDMNGEGFDLYCKTGQRVSAGDRLLTFDRNAVKAAGCSDMVIMIVTNADDYPNLDIVPENK